MRKLSIFPWSMDSEPAERVRNEVSKLLGYKVFKVFANKGFQPSNFHAILDWGRSDLPPWNRPDLKWLNHPNKVKNSVDKVRTFQCFAESEVRHVPFTLSFDKARGWAEQGLKVCIRTKTNGYDGDGLLLTDRPAKFRDALLFTKFVPSTSEYRVYVFRGEVLDHLKKVPGGDTSSDEIRTEKNGWEYARSPYMPLPEDCARQSIKAIKAVGLDFGGVDVLYGQDHKAYILETNTAPDILGQTVRVFSRRIVEWLEEVS